MTFCKKIILVSGLLIVLLGVAVTLFVSFSRTTPEENVVVPPPDPPIIKTDEEYYRWRNETFHKWAPYLEESGIEPQHYSVEGAFISCVRAKDLERALFWVPHIEIIGTAPEDNDFLKGYAYEAVGDYETALKYYVKPRKNPRILYHELIRTYYYLGQYDKSADLLCDAIVRIGKHTIHYTKNDFKSFRENYLFNTYGLSQPFTRIDEMMAFLEEQKTTSSDPKKFDEALDVLRRFKPVEPKPLQ